jgi:hypothetical protein
MSDLCDAITSLIQGGKLSATSVSAILKAVTIRAQASNLSSKDIVECIEILSRGRDGLAGTADDLIPASTMIALKVLLDNDLVVELSNSMLEDVTKPAGWIACYCCQPKLGTKE